MKEPKPKLSRSCCDRLVPRFDPLLTGNNVLDVLIGRSPAKKPLPLFVLDVLIGRSPAKNPPPFFYSRI
jgi:hypothetical protein